MTKDDIIKLLTAVKYPGYNRDIVSFGLVKDIIVDGEQVEVVLSYSTDNEEAKDKLRVEISELLATQGAINNSVIFIDPKQQQPKVDVQQMNQQPVLKGVDGVKYVIAVASAKGGVGKSTVALNLATSLSKNYNVGLLDLDIYGPSLPTITGLMDVPKVTADQKIVPLNKFGMRLMSLGYISGNDKPIIWRGPLVSRMVNQFLDDVMWAGLDFLVLDLPPGTGDVQLTLAQKLALDGVVIVTTPQELAAIDVRKGADMFKQMNAPILGIVENMTHFLCPHCNKESELFPGEAGRLESARLGVPLLGQIFMSPDLVRSSDEGEPFVNRFPESVISKSFTEIAEQIASAVDKD